MAIIAIVKAVAAAAAAHPFITGAILNVALNARNINSFGSFAAYAGIGAISGGAAAGAGGAIGSVLGSFWGSLAAGAAGGLIGGFGNASYAGASFGQALAFGFISAGIGAAAGVALYGAGKAIGAIEKAAATRGKAAGVKTPLGQQGKGSATSSLNANKGESASGSQALSSRGTTGGNSEQIDRIVIRKSAAEVYRQGTFADEATGWKGNLIKGEQWATENPLTTPNYSQKYGLPAQNTGKPDWVATGHVRGEYGTQPAPGSYNNPANTGGATEVIPKSPDNVVLDSFYMPED